MAGHPSFLDNPLQPPELPNENPTNLISSIPSLADERDLRAKDPDSFHNAKLLPRFYSKGLTPAEQENDPVPRPSDSDETSTLLPGQPFCEVKGFYEDRHEYEGLIQKEHERQMKKEYGPAGRPWPETKSSS